MAYPRRCARVTIALSLLLSLGMLAPPSTGDISAAIIEVSMGESIQDAIDAATPGDVIIVGPGTYTEDLTIDKSLTLISSDGSATTTIVGLVDIDLLDNEVMVFGEEGAGFTVTNPAGPGIDARLDYWSVLTIEGNTIVGNASAGLRFDHVHYFSEAEVRGNQISENDEAGIEVGTFGEAVRYHSTVSILDNVITANDHEGIDWDDTFNDSHGLIQGNTITGNGDDGIWHDDVEHGSSLDIIDNTVSDNLGRGIFIYEYEDGCEGLIQGNTIERNAGDGLEMSDGPVCGSRLAIQSNIIIENGEYGLRIENVEDGGYLAISNNEILNNQLAGIRLYELDAGGEGLINGNTIDGNHGHGIYVRSGLDYGGFLTIEGNTLNNTQSGEVTAESPNGWGNEYGLEHDDVVPGSETVYVDGTPTMAYTLDADWGRITFDVAPVGAVTVDYSYGGTGIFVGDEVGEGSDLTILGNEIADNDVTGVDVAEIERGGEVVISEGNTISRNGARGVAVGSRYYDSWYQDWYYYGVVDGSSLSVSDNEVCGNGDSAIDVLLVEEGSRVLVESNTLSGNAYGVYVGEMSYGSALDILENDISSNTSGGIHAGDTVDESAVNVIDNVISGNGGGLDIRGDDGLDQGTAVVRCNTITDNYEWGIDLVVDAALVDISGNDISDNGNGSDNGGIRIDGQETDLVGVHQNSIDGNDDYGLLNLSAETLDATHNWWGDASGPVHSTNPTGAGDQVSDDVEYADWLSTGPALCAEYEPVVVDPATITVGASGEDYAAIQAAIDAADPGDIILVSPGTYSENLSIEKSLTVQSTGGADVTTVDGMVFIDLERAETGMFGGDGAGFTVTGGSPGFYLEVSSWSQLTVQGNVVHDCDANGIYVDHVRGWSVLSIVDNVISHNYEHGIDVLRIERFSEMRIEGNAITGNVRGIDVEVVRYSSELEMRANVVENNAGIGINLSTSGQSVDYGSSLVMVDNEITANGFDGCNGGRGFYCDGLFNGSNIRVEGNTLSGNASDGFYLDRLEHGCSLDIVDNQATENGRRGIAVNEYWDGSEGLIQGNVICGNALDGLFIHNDVTTGSQLIVRDNEILANGGMGFRVDEVKKRGHLSVVDNRIEHNSAMGIYLYEMDSGGDSIIAGNSVAGNVLYGIHVRDGADLGAVLTMTSNTITGTGAEVTGAYVGAGCGGETYFYPPNAPYYDNHGDFVPDSVRVYLDGVEVPADEYEFHSWFGITFDIAPEDGVLVTADFTLEVGGWGIYVDNDVDEGTELAIRSNQITDNLQSGIFIRDINEGASVVIGEANVVSGNGTHGIAVGRDEYGVRNGSSLSIADNEILDNAGEGIRLHKVESGSDALIEANSVADNGGSGLWLCGEADTLKDSEAVVHGNVIDANDDWGIYAYIEHSAVDASACNKVTGNAAGGMYIDGADLRFVDIHNNNVEDNTEWGLLNESGETLDALSNWWGDVSGPYHPDGNAAGVGNAVSDDVQYQPWMLSACEPSGIVAGLKASTRTGEPGVVVRFTDLSESGCEIVEWLWDFGDGGSSTEQNAAHRYLKAGVFSVTLTVRDACGYSDSTTMKAYITVVQEVERDETPEPANLGVSYLHIDPLQVLPGQAVNVSANVCNRGGETGTTTVSFMVSGETIESQTVSVSGGTCQQVTFTVARAVPGTYQVAIDGMVGQFSVLSSRTVVQTVPPQQQNGLGTAGIVAVIVVMLVLIGGLVAVFRRI